jgi:prolyl oligopeptidase PreP (S9A serine peptidase family)
VKTTNTPPTCVLCGMSTNLTHTQILDVSGRSYPRTVREWRRGTALCDAPTVFECRPEEMMVSSSYFIDRGGEWEVRTMMKDFYHTDQWWRKGSSGKWVHTSSVVPDDVSLSTFGDQMLCSLRSEWLGFSAGSLLACDADALLLLAADGASLQQHMFTPLFIPSQQISLDAVTQVIAPAARSTSPRLLQLPGRCDLCSAMRRQSST